MRMFTLSLLILCERANPSFKEANPGSEGPNSMSIFVREPTIAVRELTLGTNFLGEVWGS